jgi:tRNA U34 5-methylaminomethyl-2-thiouridine-forming methyltransferase MnmC
VLEMGLGTGLNALLTLVEAEKRIQHVHYTAIELYPLQVQEIASLNYCRHLMRDDLQPVFKMIHECDWEKDIALSEHFTLRKIATSIQDYEAVSKNDFKPFHLVYYDAFAPVAQPELWTKEIFTKLFYLMERGALLVTYCSKSMVRLAMQSAGFKVEKIPGPLGKREMVKAVKL